MNKKKYYYTDPLKVAWMSREHEVKFEFNGKPFADDFDFTSLSLETVDHFNLRYHVQMGCSSIFELKIGDLVLHENACVAKRLQESKKVPGLYIHFQGCLGNIIERDKKVFFMPEVEFVSLS